MTLPEGKVIYSTHGKDVISSAQRTNLELLAPCTHEEADARLMHHAMDVASSGYKLIKIRSNDTDVVALAIASSPPDVSEECMSVIERFVVLLYDRTSNLLEVNQSRKELFPKRFAEGFTIL